MILHCRSSIRSPQTSQRWTHSFVLVADGRGSRSRSRSSIAAALHRRPAEVNAQSCRTLDRMSIEEALRQALAEAARASTSPRAWPGFPATVHGGAVAALLYRVTAPRPPARIRLDLLRGVPTETPLRLTTGSTGPVARLGLAHQDRRLAEAELARI